MMHALSCLLEGEQLSNTLWGKGSACDASCMNLQATMNSGRCSSFGTLASSIALTSTRTAATVVL